MLKRRSRNPSTTGPDLVSGGPTLVQNAAKAGLTFFIGPSKPALTKAMTTPNTNPPTRPAIKKMYHGMPSRLTTKSATTVASKDTRAPASTSAIEARSRTSSRTSSCTTSTPPAKPLTTASRASVFGWSGKPYARSRMRKPIPTRTTRMRAARTALPLRSLFAFCSSSVGATPKSPSCDVHWSVNFAQDTPRYGWHLLRNAGKPRSL